MAVNPIVNGYGTADETRLLDDLVSEIIQQRGVDLLYIPRIEDNLDMVTMEDPLVRYEAPYEIEFYINNFESFQGDGHFMDKIGIRITDQINLKVSSSRFQELMRPLGLRRPREGDLIWFTLGKRMFEIKFVDTWPDFYPIGHLPSIDMRCELFEYSGQRFDTGIPDIDLLNGYLPGTDAQNPNTTPVEDPSDDADRIQDAADVLLDFSELDPFAEGQY